MEPCEVIDLADASRGPDATHCGHCADELKPVQIWPGNLILGSYALGLECWLAYIKTHPGGREKRPEILEVYRVG